MAADLNREAPYLLGDPVRLQQFVAGQAAVRSLTEAIVFDRLGNVLARTGLSFGLEMEYLPPGALTRAEAGEVVTVTSSADDRVRALVQLFGFGDAYLFVGRFVDAEVLGFMQRTQSVVREYQQLSTERRGIQITSAILFGLVALLLLFAAVWTGMAVADRIVAPIGQLIGAADRVRTGDLLARVPEGASDDEIAVLSRAFNRMATQLHSQRRELIDANHQLDARRRFTEAVLSGVTAGVIGLDDQRRIVLPNRAASHFLESAAGGEIAGVDIQHVLPETLPLFERAELAAGQTVQQQVTVRRGLAEYTLLVRLAAQREGDAIVGYVLTFDDITVLLSAQRQAAWAEVARRIAHEIKNPLTPIQLSAERMGAQVREPDRRGRPVVLPSRGRHDHPPGRRHRPADPRVLGLRPDARRPHATRAARRARAACGGPAAERLSELRLTVDLGDSAGLYLDCDGEKISQALTNVLQNAVQAVEESAAGADQEEAVARRPCPW
ncbi:MAG: HAMP domain-containing protein [Geminicoccaceae bacterium]